MSAGFIQGSWTHSFEEDQGDVQVYRPTHSFAFPPARGRESLDFGSSGQLTKMSPGPDDRPREMGGRWTPLGMNRFRLDGAANGPGQVIEILEHTNEILKIRKV